MPNVTIAKSVAVQKTARVTQLCGSFDVPPTARSERTWEAHLPYEQHPWQVGLIVGPSGCGKSTIARELFGGLVDHPFDWPDRKSLVDAFPKDMSIKEITGLLSSVGFSSPPSWLRPFHALSNGEQFRTTLARTLAEHPQLAVVDEFTSVVDRQVAQIGSHAVAKTVRRRGGQFVAVGCHYDVIDWLDPDWIYEPHTDEFHWRLERQARPAIDIKCIPVTRAAWQRFAPHHYLSTSLANSSQCFVGLVNDDPAVFTAVLSFPHPTVSGWREHRTVCLPDFQGCGIGNAFAELIAAAWAATGKRYSSTTSHPAMIHHRAKSPLWNMARKTSHVPGIGSTSTLHKMNHPVNNSRSRLTAGFIYTGPPNPQAAKSLGIL